MRMSYSKKILFCRSCKKRKIIKLFKLGNLSFTGIFPKSRKQIVPTGPLTLVICNNCKLVQLLHNFNLKFMYGTNYGYRSSLNPSMIEHLKLKANYLKKFLKKKNIIVDIGSNDGTFLSFFSEKNTLIGIDPTIKKFKKFYKKNIKTIPKFFPPKNKSLTSKVDLFTSIACFYDLPDPLNFAQNISKKLNDNGLWHFEQSYLPSMLRNLSFDTICHEHLEYYSITSIKYILDKSNLKIIDIKFNNINGGSVAITAAKKNSQYKEFLKINLLLEKEKKMNIHKVTTYKIFYKKILGECIKLKEFINREKKNNKIFSCLGASTKGNVILQFCKLNSKRINKIYEVNKDKYDHYSPGSLIKIYKEKLIKKDKPDYLIVLPWHFKNFFKKNKKKLFGNVKLVFPLPKFNVV
jgi:hypothetical protein